MVAYEAARGGFLDDHIRRLRQVYHERRDVMLDALTEFFPPEVTWTHPAGGLFLWARLPEEMNSARLLEAALRQKVAFVPGDAFFAGSADSAENNRYLRLNFSNAKPDMIVEGIRRLGQVIKEQTADGDSVPSRLRADVICA